MQRNWKSQYLIHDPVGFKLNLIHEEMIDTKWLKV